VRGRAEGALPGAVRRAPKPLKLRIQADIQQRAPGVFTRKVLSIFLSRYTGSGAYLVAMGKATQRFDLDGQPAGEISAEHHEAAAQELTRRRALRKEREQQAEQARRAQWQAQQEQQRAEQQARRDRLQLLRAFENSSLTKANFCALKGLTPEALDAQLAQARQEAADWAAQQPAQAPRGDDRPPRRDDRPPRRDDRGPRPERREGRDGRPPQGPRGDRRDGPPGGRPRNEGPRSGRPNDPRNAPRPDRRPPRPAPAPAPAAAPSTAADAPVPAPAAKEDPQP
jgi:ProP effector